MTLRTGLRCLILAGVSAWGIVGCQTTDPKTETQERKLDVTDGRPFRPSAKKHEDFFLNPKSREIERSLGL